MKARNIIRRQLRQYVNEASAGEEAKKRGLKHVSFGRYADPSDPSTVVAKSVKGKLVAVKPQADTEPQKKAAPKEKGSFGKSAETILGKKTGGPAGSNEGGFYTGTDGVKRYVKFYRDADQGKSEHLSNAIYNMLGVGAPNSHLFMAGDRPGFASDIVDGEILNKHGLDKGVANKILDGFAADILVGNWDAVGLVHDNVLVDTDGNPIRIDNGGTLTYRAQGGKKPDHLQTDITEFEGFSNPDLNREYSKVFQAAGIDNGYDLGSRFVSQVKDIAKLYKKLDGDWSKLVRKIVPDWDDQSVQEASNILQARTKKLIQLATEEDGKFADDSEPDDGGVREFTQESDAEGELNGVPFESWVAPKSIDEWKNVDGVNPSIEEPPFESKGLRKSAGVIIEEPDGRIWVVEPANHFGGYKHTFPKGGIEEGLEAQNSAIKEAYEETGLKVSIESYFGDFSGDTSVTRYYRAKRVGGKPTDYGWESQAVKLIPRNQLKDYLNRERDQKISQKL